MNFIKENAYCFVLGVVLVLTDLDVTDWQLYVAGISIIILVEWRAKI